VHLDSTGAWTSLSWRIPGPLAAQLTALAQPAPLVLAGAGATPKMEDAVGAWLLAEDPVPAVQNVEWPR
jgi:hypothetical protein